MIFRCFVFIVFLRVVLEGFWERFGVDFETIFEEILGVGRCNFGCGASLAKCHLDSLFTILEACRRFRKQWTKMQNLRNLRPISARSGRRGFWKHFGSILGQFSEALGSQNRRKCDPKTKSKKRSQKSHARVCRRIRHNPVKGGGCPYNPTILVPWGALLNPMDTPLVA